MMVRGALFAFKDILQPSGQDEADEGWSHKQVAQSRRI